MKNILLTLVYFGILFEASNHQIMAQNFSNFTCPHMDEVIVDRSNNNSNQYPWYSKLFPSDWKGQGEENVDNFLEVSIKNYAVNSVVTCYYKADNNDTKKNRNEKNPKEVPPPPDLNYGTISVTVPYLCKFSSVPHLSSCQTGISECAVTCSKAPPPNPNQVCIDFQAQIEAQSMDKSNWQKLSDRSTKVYGASYIAYINIGDWSAYFMTKPPLTDLNPRLKLEKYYIDNGEEICQYTITNRKIWGLGGNGSTDFEFFGPESNSTTRHRNKIH
ncbi:MAG TPA: hypothetical protein VMW10_06415 [Alphaproteobacteria bacterium]|nr:hypothetical protein [Alphaproteobacteria bacterium]